MHQNSKNPMNFAGGAHMYFPGVRSCSFHEILTHTKLSYGHPQLPNNLRPFEVIFFNSCVAYI